MISKSAIHGSRVLVVEDSPTQAMELRHLLEEDGYIVDVAENGSAALRQIESSMPSLIISDVVMPEMNGYELCTQIKEDNALRAVPFILLTTLSSATDVIQGLECGADNFVTKPYDADMLLARVSANLINRELRKKNQSDVGIDIYFGGREYTVSASRMQILDLLLSTYETAYMKSQSLEKAHDELRDLNARLELKVAERTEHLNQINHLLKMTRDVNVLSGNVSKREELFRLCCALLTSNGYFSYAAIVLTDDAGVPVQIEEDCQDESCPVFFKQLSPEHTIPHCIMQSVSQQGLITAEWKNSCKDCIVEQHCKGKKLLLGRMLSGERLLGVVILSPTEDLKLESDHFGVFGEIVSEVAARITTLDQNTKLRENEATLRAISDSAQDGIIMLDNNLDVTFWNPAAEIIFGYSADEIIGNPLHDVLVPKSLREQAHKGLVAFQSTGSGPVIGQTLEVTAERKNGEKFPIEISVSAVKMEGKWHAVGIVRDIEERKKIEVQTALTQKLQSIGELSAGIAHEINTPTQYISSNVSFLERSFGTLKGVIEAIEAIVCKKGADGEKTKECLQYEQAMKDMDLEFLFEEVPPAIHGCSDGVERIAGLVESMRYFAHPGQDAKTTFDMNTAIENAIVISRNEWKYYADVSTSLQNDLPSINCYAAQVNQVLLNIIVNAAQAISSVIGESPKEKGKISILSKQDGEWVEVWISDTGPGISDSILQRIFDPFFTTKEVGKGTGQGLTLAHTVVEKHGGRIVVETEQGEGTTFIIRLPIEAEQD